jgi:hypothetical protein
MSSGQYLLNVVLLGYILISNLGTRVVTVRRFVVPVAIVAVAAFTYLRNVPTASHDVQLELAGVVAGVAFGIAAALLVRPGRDAAGRVTMTAGAPYAALWILVIGGRMLFAYGADHWFAAAVTTFSIENRITGADAWTAAFVLMALAMVLVRVLAGAIQTMSVPRVPAAVTA